MGHRGDRQVCRPWRGLLLGALAWLGCCAPAAASLINEWEPMEVAGETPVQARETQPGQPWVEPLSGMRFVWVPGGCYRMGSPPRVEGRDADEGPVHESCVAGFWMGEREVTQGQWRRIMRNNPSQFRKGDEYPVERVAWDDVDAYVRKLNQIYPGRIFFRLPTEAEWEYACRNAGQRIRFAGGNDPAQVGWFQPNSGGTPQPTGSRAPNPLGLYDLSGNVWEWTQDIYDGQAYAKLPKDNPVMVNGTSFRAIRGGAWNTHERSLRCANRGFQLFSSKRNDLGFRLVRVIDTTEERRKELKELGF